MKTFMLIALVNWTGPNAAEVATTQIVEMPSAAICRAVAPKVEVAIDNATSATRVTVTCIDIDVPEERE